MATGDPRVFTWLVTSAVIAGCAQSQTSVCSNGVRCPLDKVCSPAGDACVDLFGCGNGIVERDEVCDDGNRASGDGCSADCGSDETCGNAVADFEEPCDGQPPTGVSCVDLGHDFGHLACVECAIEDAGCGGLEWLRMPTDTPLRLHAVWGAGREVAFAVGQDGALLQYEDGAWAKLTPAGLAVTLEAVWGDSSTRVYAVGQLGAVWHYDGQDWTQMPQSITTEALNGLCGNAAGDLYAVGDGGIILHHDGQDWTRIAHQATSQTLRAAWCDPGGDHVYAVGDQGAIVHYDGQQVSAMASPTQADLSGITATPSGVLFAVGDQGTILRSTDVQPWQETAPPTPMQLYAVWGSSASDVFAVGAAGTVLHHDGAAWTRMTSTVTEALHGVWGADTDHVFAAGDGGEMLYHGPDPWTRLPVPMDEAVHDLWAASPTDVFAVGANGTIAHYDGLAWTPMQSSTAEWLYGVWGSGPDDVFAVGMSGTVVHYSGSEPWTVVDPGSRAWLRSVWGRSDTDLYAVGDSSEVLHYRRYDGTWTSYMPPADPGDFRGVGGSAKATYVVGDQGLFRLSDDEPGDALVWLGDRDLVGVWGSPVTDDVLAVGRRGAIVHYRDGQKIPRESPTTSDLGAIWASSVDSVFAAGAHDALIHCDSNTCAPIVTRSRLGDVHSVWVAGDGTVFIASERNTIHRLHLPDLFTSPDIPE